MNIRMGKSKSRTRDLGLDNGSAGKGSANRVTDLDAFRAGYGEAFKSTVRSPGRFRKVWK